MSDFEAYDEKNQRIPKEVVEREADRFTSGMSLPGQGLIEVLTPQGFATFTFCATSKEHFHNVMKNIAEHIYTQEEWGNQT
jgi:hypothetical protein